MVRSRTLGDNGDIRKRGALRLDASYGAPAGSHGGDPSPPRRPFFGPGSVQHAGGPPELPYLVLIALGSRSSVVPGRSTSLCGYHSYTYNAAIFAS